MIIWNNLDRQRAAGVALKLARVNATVADEPLIVDLIPPADPRYHYIAEAIAFVAHLVTRRPDPTVGVVPISGLYLCPPETPTETTAQAVAGWNAEARPFPLSSCVDSVPIGAGPPFAFSVTHAPGFKITIPVGFFLRAIVVAAPGTATPGPGAGSFGTLRALLHREVDVC